MITGYPNVETASEAVRLGAFDYIPKPVRQTSLLHVAQHALKHKTLQDENEKYRKDLEAIFRSVKDAIVTVDRNMIVTAVNDAAKSICNITNEWMGKPFGSFNTNCAGKCFDALKKTLHSKQDVELQRTECLHNKPYRQVVTIRTTPLLDSHGDFMGAVMIVRDETLLNELERSLQERDQFHNMISRNIKMQNIYALIEDLAPEASLFSTAHGARPE